MPNREALLVACARAGLVDPKSSEIARRAGVCTEIVRRVLAGQRTSEASRRAVLVAIGVEVAPVEAAHAA